MWNRFRNPQDHGGMVPEGINSSLKGTKARDGFRYGVIPGFYMNLIHFYSIINLRGPEDTAITWPAIRALRYTYHLLLYHVLRYYVLPYMSYVGQGRIQTTVHAYQSTIHTDIIGIHFPHSMGE